MAEDEKKRRRGGPEMTLLDQAKAKQGNSVYHCNYCNKDLSNVVRIRCAQCDDFDLCLECFSVGAEVTPHKNDHPYKVQERLDFPLIEEDWTAAEEMLLLDGIETFGLGNWADVAMHVGTKSKARCESHYFRHYVDGVKDCIPDLSRAVSKSEFIVREEDRIAAQQDALAAAQPKKPQPNPTRKDINFYGSCPAGSDVVGYMPARGDFDIEWDNDAETILCDLAIKPEDTPFEVDFKTKILEIYNWKLDERARRKKFILERGLLDLKKQQALERRRSKEEREIYQQMRVFSRFQTPEEHEEFMRGLLMERKIRKRIEQLQTYRQLGIQTLADGEAYEAEKRRKESNDKAKSEKYGSSSYVYSDKKAAARRRDKEEAAELAGPPKRARAAVGCGDINLSAAVELLSEKEKELCTNIKITPLQYMAAKDIMLREFAKMGNAQRSTARKLVKVVDVSKTDKIFDFVLSAGWLNPDRDPRMTAMPSSNGARFPPK